MAAKKQSPAVKDPFEEFDDFLQTRTERGKSYERLGDTARFIAAPDVTFEELCAYARGMADKYHGRFQSALLDTDRSAIVRISMLAASHKVRRGLHTRRGTGLPATDESRGDLNTKMRV